MTTPDRASFARKSPSGPHTSNALPPNSSTPSRPCVAVCNRRSRDNHFRHPAASARQETRDPIAHYCASHSMKSMRARSSHPRCRRYHPQAPGIFKDFRAPSSPLSRGGRQQRTPVHPPATRPQSVASIRRSRRSNASTFAPSRAASQHLSKHHSVAKCPRLKRSLGRSNCDGGIPPSAYDTLPSHRKSPR